VIRRFAVLILLLVGSQLIEPLRVPTEGVIGPATLLSFGILLLTADTLGQLAHDLRLPRLIGYLFAGLLLGPTVMAVVPEGAVRDLGMMKQLAVGVIGLLAGVELRLPDVRRRWRTIVAILVAQTLIVVVLLTAGLLLLRGQLPFLAGLGAAATVAVVVLVATTLTVNSPMVTLALLTETRAQGPVAKTVLGVVLLADVVIIVLFTVALATAQATVGEGSGVGPGVLLLRLWTDVLGSIVAGVLIGTILTLYLRFVQREMILFAVLVVFATAFAAQTLHFELLLSLLVAGFLVENVAPVRAEPLVHALEQTAGPVFVVFFALAGAELHVAAFQSLWPVVLVLAALRALGIFAGARLGSIWGGAELQVRRYAWMGLISQAGVALGLATLIAERFPAVGIAAQAVIVGVIALNETVGPILFRQALVRAGEVEREDAPVGVGGAGASLDPREAPR
jgi:Kef-type K+ transport system membrane component KefB